MPTAAYVYMVSTIENGGFWQNGASLNGETLVFIYGSGFGQNVYSAFASSSDNSNTVALVNSFASYNCEVFAMKSTTSRLACWTP